MVLRLFKRLLRALRIRYYGSTRYEPVSQDGIEAITALPNSCLRGLRKANWVLDGSLIATDAFAPDSRTAEQRTDGGKETSVNWEDDSQAEKLTLSDKNKAGYGAARIATADIAQTSNTVVAVATPLLCERKRLPENPYHGNIVFSAKVGKRMEMMLAASLALKSSFIPPV